MGGRDTCGARARSPGAAVAGWSRPAPWGSTSRGPEAERRESIGAVGASRPYRGRRGTGIGESRSRLRGRLLCGGASGRPPTRVRHGRTMAVARSDAGSRHQPPTLNLSHLTTARVPSLLKVPIACRARNAFAARPRQPIQPPPQRMVLRQERRRRERSPPGVGCVARAGRSARSNCEFILEQRV